jgi:hypothetical protein
MKIGEQPVDEAKAIARRDEEPVSRENGRSVPSSSASALKQTERGGADATILPRSRLDRIRADAVSGVTEPTPDA